MSRDRYFFDKRVIKKGLIKYGIMFVIALPILIVLNIYVFDKLSFWGATLLDCVVLLAVVAVCLVVYNKIEARKAQKEQEEIERQKQLNKARRKVKKQAQKNGNNSSKINKEVNDVEIITPDDKEK